MDRSSGSEWGEPFVYYGLSTVDIASVRNAFAGWPR